MFYQHTPKGVASAITIDGDAGQGLTRLHISKVHREDHDMPVGAEADEVVLESIDEEDGKRDFSICTETVIQLSVTRVKTNLKAKRHNDRVYMTRHVTD